MRIQIDLRWVTSAVLLTGLVGCMELEDLDEPEEAALSAAATSNPLFSKGYLVADTLPGVDRSGNTDSTAGLNNAIKLARQNNLVLYLTPGAVYTVSGTLKAYTNGANSPKATQSVVIVGSKTNRPTIKLRPNTAAFSNASAPRVMMDFKNFDTNSFVLADEKPNSGFFNMIRDVRLDCSSNPGAICLYFNQAQDSSVEDVSVVATGSHTGIYGLPSRAWGAINIEVTGGKYGIDLTPNTPVSAVDNDTLGRAVTVQGWC